MQATITCGSHDRHFQAMTISSKWGTSILTSHGSKAPSNSPSSALSAPRSAPLSQVRHLSCQQTFLPHHPPPPKSGSPLSEEPLTIVLAANNPIYSSENFSGLVYRNRVFGGHRELPGAHHTGRTGWSSKRLGWKSRKFRAFLRWS